MQFRLNVILGVATFSVRRINNDEGTQNILEIKCPLNAMGHELLQKIANKLELKNKSQVKCIAAGKIVKPDSTLISQDLKNNQQLMVIISQLDRGHSANNEAMYDRIKKIKMDVEALVDSKRHFFEVLYYFLIVLFVFMIFCFSDGRSRWKSRIFTSR